MILNKLNAIYSLTHPALYLVTPVQNISNKDYVVKKNITRRVKIKYQSCNENNHNDTIIASVYFNGKTSLVKQKTEINFCRFFHLYILYIYVCK